MENDTPPLMRSWAPNALKLFEEEFKELDALSQMEEEAFQLELEQAKAQATKEAQQLLRPTTSGSTTSTSKKAPTSSKGNRHAEEAAFNAAKIAKVLEERALQLQEKSAQQSWRQLMNTYNDQLENANAAAKPVLQWERKELDFFTSHNMEYFTMGDILAIDRPRPQEASAASSPQSQRPSSAPASPSKRKAKDTKEVSEAAADTSAPTYIIDAVQFAQNYNKALEQEYAYKVVLGTHDVPVSTTHTAEAENPDLLRSRLAEHKPGLDLNAGEFCVTHPNKNVSTNGGDNQRLGNSSVKHTSSPDRPVSSSRTLKVDENMGQTKKEYFLPSLTADNNNNSNTNNKNLAATAAATYSGGRERADWDVHSGATAGTNPFSGANLSSKVAPLSSSLTLPSLKGDKKRGRSQPPPSQSRKSKNNNLMDFTSATAGATNNNKKAASTKKGPSTDGIECSQKEIELRACVGQTAQTVIRFTNRRAFRTRMRIQNAVHPWLTYECTHIAPAAGSSAQANVPYETPLSSGGYIEVTVTFHAPNMSEPDFAENLQLGICREINSRDGEGAQWVFLEIPVHCVTVAPLFKLTFDEEESSELRDEVNGDGVFNFPYTFVLGETTLNFKLENLGSKALVNLLTDSPAFVLQSKPEDVQLLENGAQIPVEINFFPKDEGVWQGNLVVIVRDDEDGPVLAEHLFALEGEAVVPRVRVLHIDTLEIEDTGRPQWSLTDGEDIPRYVLEHSTPGVCSYVSVLVENEAPIPLPFRWKSEHATVENGGEVLISPEEGVLVPHSKTEFTISITPRGTSPLYLSWNLFLLNLPMLSQYSAEDVREVPDEILSFYAVQDKVIPSAAAVSHQTDTYADPFFVFQQSTRSLAEEDGEGTFASGFFVYAVPVAPQMVIVPSCLEEAVECLIRFENARRVTLQNRSPRPLHFFFNPTENERPNESSAGTSAEVFNNTSNYGYTGRQHSDDINVRCVPRTGVIPPFKDMRIDVYFTVLQVGACSAVIDCFIPEIAESVGGVVNGASNLQLDIRVTGVGPSVHTSTEYLDFGLVEMGKEVEASFTVTNDNPTPIEFDLQDPMMREPPRFVFIPPSFRLGPGDSVEVTVYRKGVSVEDEQTFFEVVVRDGATVAIETRATIQAATMVLDDAYLSFGSVPEGEWNEGVFYLSNMSALDIPFTIEPGAAASPFIDLDYPASAVLRAGQSHIPIKIRGRFYYNPDSVTDPDAYRTLLGLRSPRGNQILLVEVRCDFVQRLSVVCELLPIGGTQLHIDPTATAPSSSSIADRKEEDNNEDGAEEVVEDKEQEDEDFTRVTLKAPFPVASPTHGARAVPAPVHYYPCASVNATMPDTNPLVEQTLALSMLNETGCNTTFSMEATNYIVLDTIRESALEMIKKKKLEGTTTTMTGNKQSALISKGSESAVQTISEDRPVFWSTAKSGAETLERQRRNELSNAQDLLVDGRGCATFLVTASSGALKPNEALPLSFTLFANLPGEYKETVKLQCGALPLLAIPVCLQLKGRPLLLDPTTSGLTTENGKQVLVMPSAIAPLGVSRRKLRLFNRIPRDVAVKVNSYLGIAAFVVAAVDDSVNATEVVLRLGPVVKQNESKKGKTNVCPAEFILPAMSTTEVTVEYTPAAAMVEELLARIDRAANNAKFSKEEEDEDEEGDAVEILSTSAREVRWEGSLVVTAEIARTEFNDAFFIDEFYIQNAEKYPSTRALTTTRVGNSTSAEKSISRPIQSLQLQPPLRTRPGRVVQKNRIIYPTETEQRRLEKAGYGSSHEHSQADATASAAAMKSTSYLQNIDHSDSDNDEEDEDGNGAPSRTRFVTGKTAEVEAPRPDEELVAEAVERAELLEFIERRREEAIEESRKYFLPMELRLRAQCGIPRLVVEPSPTGVYLPPYQVNQEHCSRTVRLTNRNRAALSFALEVQGNSAAVFKIACTQMLLCEMEEDLLIDSNDGEALLRRREAQELKWSDIHEQRKAEKMLMKQTRAKESERIKKTEMVAFEPSTIFTLQCGDSIDVVVALTDAELLRHVGQLEAALTIHYQYQIPGKIEGNGGIASEAGNPKSGREGHYSLHSLNSTTAAKVRAGHKFSSRAGVSEVETVSAPPAVVQCVPLYATYAVAEVRCSPATLWFKPGQTSHDGRAQPDYALPLTLSNYSTQEVSFELVPLPFSDLLAAETTFPSSATMGRPQELSRQRKVREVVHQLEQLPSEEGEGLMCVRDHAAAFTVFGRQGVIPAATAGGQPGQTTVRIRFKEHSNVRYECVYCVYINGDPTDEVILLRGDSRETEV